MPLLKILPMHDRSVPIEKRNFVDVVNQIACIMLYPTDEVERGSFYESANYFAMQGFLANEEIEGMVSVPLALSLTKRGDRKTIYEDCIARSVKRRDAGKICGRFLQYCDVALNRYPDNASRSRIIEGLRGDIELETRGKFLKKKIADHIQEFISVAHLWAAHNAICSNRAFGSKNYFPCSSNELLSFLTVSEYYRNFGERNSLRGEKPSIIPSELSWEMDVSLSVDASNVSISYEGDFPYLIKSLTRNIGRPESGKYDWSSFRDEAIRILEYHGGIYRDDLELSSKARLAEKMLDWIGKQGWPDEPQTSHLMAQIDKAIAAYERTKNTENT